MKPIEQPALVEQPQARWSESMATAMDTVLDMRDVIMEQGETEVAVATKARKVANITGTIKVRAAQVRVATRADTTKPPWVRCCNCRNVGKSLPPP